MLQLSAYRLLLFVNAFCLFFLHEDYRHNVFNSMHMSIRLYIQYTLTSASKEIKNGFARLIASIYICSDS